MSPQGHKIPDCIFSIDKIHAKEMQDQTPQHEIRKGSLMAVTEFLGVLRVRLDAEGGCQDELADCGGETGEEGVERLRKGYIRKRL